MVRRERTDRVRLGGKRDKPQAVIGPLHDEFFQDRLDDIQAVKPLAVDRKVFRRHTRRRIQEQSHVDAFGLGL